MIVIKTVAGLPKALLPAVDIQVKICRLAMEKTQIQWAYVGSRHLRIRINAREYELMIYILVSIHI